jgi:hypothetical protein
MLTLSRTCKVTIAKEEKPPLRFLAGTDAVDTAEQVTYNSSPASECISRNIQYNGLRAQVVAELLRQYY